jgi:small subunit ribosomal protein S15
MAANDILALSKEEIIEKFKLGDADTGSPEVQIALLTKKILDLTDHLKKHKGDNHSRRGLLGMVGRRRRLFEYLDKKNGKDYVNDLKKKLGM